MITAEEAKHHSDIAIEKEKQDNIKFIIEDIDKEIQKAINKGYYSICIPILRLVDVMKVKEYLLSYGYGCMIRNEVGNISLIIDWKDPESARKEYDELVRVKAKFEQPLFKFSDLEEVK